MLNAHRPTGWRNRTGDEGRPRPVQRGQSLVELALILPVLLLLVVVALDFGRIYLGYINVQNMARIAANEAANNPLAWSVLLPDEGVQERYRNQILEDTASTNCLLPETAGGDPIIPDPVFTDMDGDGTAVGLGDLVTVQLTCEFSVATPMIANILGGTIEVTAESNFPVKAGVTAVLPPDGSGGGSGGGGGVNVAPVAAFLANHAVFSTGAAPQLSVIGPSVVVDFRDASGGGSPTAWSWTFGDGVTSTDQDVAHQYTCALPDAFGYCTYLVEMTSSNAYGTSAATYMTIQVGADSDVNFSANTQVIDRYETVTFTDQSTPAGTEFAWTFGDGGTAVGPEAIVTHTYNAVGTYSVSLTVTYADADPASATKTGFITVNPGYCDVPKLKGKDFSQAVGIWSAAGFSGTVLRAAGAAAGDFKIHSQSIAGGSGAEALCTSDVSVSNLSYVETP